MSMDLQEIPLCQECETEPADLVIHDQGEGQLHLCETCLRGLFERVMQLDFATERGRA